MTETVSSLEVRRRLGDLLNRVALRHDQFIIERKGTALAAMVPVHKLQQLERAARRHLLRVLERQSGMGSQAAADRLGDEAKHGTRRVRRRPR